MGTVNTILEQLQVVFKPGVGKEALKDHEYTIIEEQHSSYFPGRSAAVYYKPKAIKNDTKSITNPLVPKHVNADVLKLGIFGILHPQVLEQFKIPVVISAFELNIERFQ